LRTQSFAAKGLIVWNDFHGMSAALGEISGQGKETGILFVTMTAAAGKGRSNTKQHLCLQGSTFEE
jgi:hypothetical protein